MPRSDAWREYQEQAAAFFRSLGFTATVDVPMQGARSKHDVDVLVAATAFGISQRWVVECKDWRRRVPKERVLTLQALVDDVGADRGFLLCEVGFQSGAVTAARLANITLTSLADLRENAEADIALVRWDALYQRFAAANANFHALTRPLGGGAGQMRGSMVKPGVDDYIERLGKFTMVEHGLQGSRLGRFPVPCGFDDEAETPLYAHDIEHFLDGAEAFLGQVEEWLELHLQRPWDRKQTAGA